MQQLLTKLNINKIFISCLILPILSIVLAANTLVSSANATGVYDLPPLTDKTWVVDQAGVISPTNEGKLNSSLKNLAKNTGNQVRLVAIRRLDYDKTIDSFADELFSFWFPTPEAQNHQTLLVLDTLTNNSAIRTGESVTRLMDDAIATSVAAESIGIPIREGNKYNEAFLGASDRLVAVLSGQPDPGAPQIADKSNTESTFAAAEETETGKATVWVIALLIAATVIPMATYFFYVGGISN